jgi:type II secretory pathway pseudopilin PulG
MKNLFKYQIGLAVLGLFVASMAIVLMVQAGAAKEDAQTYTSAGKIADKLDSYIYDKQKIPESLKDANISEENSNVSYKKLSDEKYEFCVTYRAKGNSIDGTSLLTSVIFGDISYEDDDYEQSRIYLNPTHDKGKNCQTAKPYINEKEATYDYQSTGASNDAYDQYYKEVDNCGATLGYSSDKYTKCIDDAAARLYGTQ